MTRKIGSHPFSLQILCSLILLCHWTTHAQDYHCDSCLVYGVGVYHGQGSSILVKRSSKPVVLVCSNYDTTNWKLSNPDSADIRLIILYGTEGAAVQGAGSTPILNRPFPSGSSVFEFEGTGYADLEAYVIKTVGRGFTRFQGSLFPAAFMITEPGGIPYSACKVLGASVYGATTGNAIKLELAPSSAPLVLLLTAYEQLTWNILNPSHVAIKEIWVSGYYPGEVTTDGDTIPIHRFYPRTKLLSSAEAITGNPLLYYATRDRTDSLYLDAANVSVAKKLSRSRARSLTKNRFSGPGAGAHPLPTIGYSFQFGSADEERIFTSKGQRAAVTKR